MRYRFGSCELRLDSHELMVDGEARAVEPQVFDVLRVLAENAGSLVSTETLIAEVWGGRVISDSAVAARISAARAAVGDDGTRQAVIKTVPRRGFRLVAEVAAAAATEAAQRVRFCASADGTRIAFATTGAGTPLVRAGHWLTHLEHDWHSPIWRPFLDALGRRFAVTRYDQRGNGLSDWQVDDFSLDAFVDDLAAVVDGAGLERFALYGTSQGAPIAVSYAVRHPERVSHLVLHGGYVQGRLVRGDAAEREQGEALQTLIRHGWGQAGSPFLQAFATMYVPQGLPEQVASLVELQRLTTSPANAAALRAAVDGFDVADLLGQVTAPTLVVHARDDGVHPLDQGRRLAAGIAGAEFLMLDSGNHAILSHEPAWGVLHEALAAFVGG